MEQFPLRSFRSSVCPNHNNPQTKPDCRPYRQSHVGCQFGRSGSSGLVGRFRLLRWSCCVAIPRVRSYRGRCRYRCTCRPVRFLAVNGCHPKRIWFPLRGRLKNGNRVRACFPLHATPKLKALYGLLPMSC